MKIVIFGASGLIGRGVLEAALHSPHVTHVLSVGRGTLELTHPKLQQRTHDDFEDFTPLGDALEGLDACFWCLGTSSAGVDEPTYTRITYTFTMAAARVLFDRSPSVCFCFVSGAGTDDTEKGRAMWARVKGKAENALGRVGFQRLFLFRPGFIRPSKGVRPRDLSYRIATPILMVFNPLLRRLGAATSSVEIGRAMIAAARGNAPGRVLDSRAINELAASDEP